MRVLTSLLLLSSLALKVYGQACNLKYFGTNLAVAEFGDGGTDHALNPNPGTYGNQYTYPTSSDAAYFVGKGMNTFRLPFRWERIQTSLGGAFDADEQSRLVSIVNSITSMGGYVLLDPHNYARYNGKLIAQSSGAVTDAHFVDFWSKMATLFKSNSKVIFGLMNEPYNLDIATWAASCNKAIAGIRAAGATQLILVPGSGWTGAHSWQSTGVCCGGSSNSVAMASITDPGNNWAYELHQYLDSDFSGTSANCPDSTSVTSAVSSTTSFLRSKGFRAFLGEFGGSTSSTCYASANNLLSHLEQNSDVWLGWTWWAAGPWWGSYFLSIEPTGSTDAGQYTNVLKGHICTSTSNSGTPSPTKAPTSASTPAPTKAPTSATTPAPTKAPTSATTPAPTAGSLGSSSSGSSCRNVWQQCGGKTYSGSTCCVSGNKCNYLSDWYSQCWPNSFHEQVHPQAQSHNTNQSNLVVLMSVAGGIIGAAITTFVGVFYHVRNRQRRSSFDTASRIPLTDL